MIVKAISGYEVLSRIYASSRTLVYRARRSEDDLSVVLKLSGQEFPSPHELARLRHEYEFTSQLNSDAVVRTLDLARSGADVAIVFEDSGGEALSCHLQNRKLSLAEQIDVAAKIATNLAAIHKENVIHKDINPTNIIYDATSDTTKLIDFGIATDLVREKQSDVTPGGLEGTLAYISPEQTGRVNRTIDHRSDLYSLGVTFYELFVGKRPFESSDALELIHSHIAKTPPYAHEVNSAVPPMLSAIIAKLMAKAAEDRYQSAQAVAADLKHCRSLLQRDGTIASFEINQREVTRQFHVPEKLYGRQAELATLTEAFGRVCTGANELVLVSGEPGVGKSALVRELQHPVFSHRGYFVSGKFDQLRRAKPYESLLVALDDLARRILTESEERLAQWRECLQQAVGELGRVITDVIATVELIIGPQPPVADLLPAESLNRLRRVFSRFISAISQAEHPLVIFLDDVQWADGASLDMLELLLSSSQTTHLLVVCAYRSAEINAAHPFLHTLAAVQDNGCTVSRVDLEPISRTDVSELLADTLSCGRDSVDALSELCFAKTNGNPFFLVELLNLIHHEGAIQFDTGRRAWHWDTDQIQNMRLCDDMGDLMAQKINLLPSEALHVFPYAACIGNAFDLKTLSAVCDMTPYQTVKALRPGLMANLIFAKNEAYKLVDEGSTGEEVYFLFVHDRVQEAAVALIDDKARSRAHLRIGQLIFDATPKDQLERNIFDVVNHKNRAVHLIGTTEERLALARFNRRAALTAKRSAAFSQYLEYAAAGMALLDTDSWYTQYDLTLSLHITCAEAQYLNGHFEKTFELVDIVDANAKDILDKVQPHLLMIRACIAQKEPNKAVGRTVPFLRQLGVRLPKKVTKAHVATAYLRAEIALWGKPPKTFFELPQMTDKHKAAAMELMLTMGAAMVFADPLLMPVAMLKGIVLCAQHGNTNYSIPAYGALGMFLCMVVGDVDRGYEFGRLAVRLLEQRDAPQIQTRTLLIFNSFTRHWKEPLHNVIQSLQKTYRVGLETGDHEYAAYTLHAICLHQINAGVELSKTKDAIEGSIRAARAIGQANVVEWFRAHRQWHENITADEGGSARLVGKTYNLAQEIAKESDREDQSRVHIALALESMLAFFYEDYEQVIRSCTEASKYTESARPFYHYIFIVFFDAVARLALLGSATKSQARVHHKEIAKDKKILLRYAKRAPHNHRSRYCIVAAEIERIRGNDLAAQRCYREAIEYAEKSNCLREEALAHELYAQYWLGRKERIIAKMYLHKAHHFYTLWGATPKVKRLEKNFPFAFESESQSEISAQQGLPQTLSASVSSSDGERESSRLTNDALDLVTILKSAQAIASSIVMDDLTANLMQTVIENSGAQWSYLVLEKDGRFVAAARGGVKVDAFVKLPDVPIEECDDISVAAISYVARSGESIVIGDASNDTLLKNDPYVLSSGAKSLMCAPLIAKSERIGVLYLENRLTCNAFTPPRVKILELLSGQIAIAIENAKLYGELETYKDHLEELVEERTAKLKETHKKLLVVSRRAGMADIATNVVHNIGNILNSVNVSVQMIHESASNSQSVRLRPLAESLGEHKDDLAAFFATGDKGPALVQYIERLSKLLEDEKKVLVETVDSLRQKIDRISNVVALQQSHTHAAPMFEPCDIGQVIQDALDENAAVIEDSNIRVENSATKVPEVVSDRHKLLTIFNRLIQNAATAIVYSKREDGVIQISATQEDENQIVVAIADNGIGIPAENLSRIFAHGFTTWSDHFGFGLHDAANWATEINGTLTAKSDGTGSGAAFKLSVPRNLPATDAG